MSKKEIRDLDVSEEEGEDVKGGYVVQPGPMPPEKNPGKPLVSAAPTVAPGAAAPAAGKALASPKDPASKEPGRMPPS